MNGFHALAIQPADESAILWSPENGTIQLRDGRQIDVTGIRWTILTRRLPHV